MIIEKYIMKTILLTSCIILLQLFYAGLLTAEPYKTGPNSGYSMSELNLTGTGISDKKSHKEEITLYPNPVRNHDGIFVKGINEKIDNASMIQLQGKQNINLQTTRKQGKNFLDPGDTLSPGVYIVEIRTESRIFREKIIVQP